MEFMIKVARESWCAKTEHYAAFSEILKIFCTTKVKIPETETHIKQATSSNTPFTLRQKEVYNKQVSKLNPDFFSGQDWNMLSAMFTVTPSPPSDFPLSVFSLYPRFARYCEYRISGCKLVLVSEWTGYKSSLSLCTPTISSYLEWRFNGKWRRAARDRAECRLWRNWVECWMSWDEMLAYNALVSERVNAWVR